MFATRRLLKTMIGLGLCEPLGVMPSGVAQATTATSTTFQSPRSLSDQNSQGTVINDVPADPIAFFGGTPQPQLSGVAQAAIARGVACGVVATIATSQTPVSVLSNTTTASGLTLIGATTAAPFQVASGDILIANKPTAQAGLGVGNVRISAAGMVGLSFSNFTALTISPTAGEKYGVVAVRNVGAISVTLTPVPVLSLTVAEQLFTVTGVRSGELVVVNKPSQQAGLDIAGVRVAANNVVGIAFSNVTITAITPTSEAYNVLSIGGMDANNNELIAQVSGGLLTAIAVSTAPLQYVTVTGLAMSDMLVGVTPYTQQPGVTFQANISIANVMGLAFSNNTTATVSPQQNAIYAVALRRMAPAAPMVTYTPTLAPIGVAANTTAEQTFTVTGLVASSVVAVNKPAVQAGLAVVGARVAAANVLGITFGNLTAAVITPNAEAWTVGNFQTPIGDTNSTWIQSASATQQNQSILTNALRAALVQCNLIPGA